MSEQRGAALDGLRVPLAAGKADGFSSTCQRREEGQLSTPRHGTRFDSQMHSSATPAVGKPMIRAACSLSRTAWGRAPACLAHLRLAKPEPALLRPLCAATPTYRPAGHARSGGGVAVCAGDRTPSGHCSWATAALLAPRLTVVSRTCEQEGMGGSRNGVEATWPAPPAAWVLRRALGTANRLGPRLRRTIAQSDPQYALPAGNPPPRPFAPTPLTHRGQLHARRMATSAASAGLELEVVEIDNPNGLNFILGCVGHWRGSWGAE